MRRSDREIKEFDSIVEVIKHCDVCRLALHDTEYPYILPLNFGLALEAGKVVLYFHGAMEGMKYELIARDNRASFEMDCAHRLVLDEEQGNCTMEYESVIGRGLVEVITEDDKKREALHILMAQYHKEDFSYNEAVMAHTKIFKLTVQQMTGKTRRVAK